MADMQRISELIVKKLRGELTAQEAQELGEWADFSPQNLQFMETRMRPEVFAEGQRILWEMNRERMRRRMRGVLSSGSPETTTRSRRKARIRRMALYIAEAAAVIILIWCATRLWVRQRPQEDALAVDATLSWKAGSLTDTAALPVQDGSSGLNVSIMKNGMAYKAGMAQLARIGSQLFVRPLPEAVRDTVVYTLYTGEKSGRVQLFFLDSTRVELAPDSYLSFTLYPSGSVVKERIIAVNGQALFDVSHNSNSPLLVRTTRQKVIVLGTLFSLRDYSREDTGSVSLYEGKVSVNVRQQTRVLRPNQRAIVHNRSGVVQVSSINLPSAEWSSPEVTFDFSELNLDSAMRQIADWYGIEHVHIGDGIDQEKTGTVLFGKVSRNISLDLLLKALEQPDRHFKLRDKTIEVTKIVQK